MVVSRKGEKVLDNNELFKSIKQIIEFYRNLPKETVFRSFQIENEDMEHKYLFDRLFRASANQLEGNCSSTYSRYAIWAEDVIYALNEALAKINSDSSRSTELITLSINALNAFKDIQYVLDSQENDQTSSKTLKNLFEEYVLWQTTYMSKGEIEEKLREVCRVTRGKIGLPRDIDVEIKNLVLTVKIQKPCCNMQDNNSAFEGWLLCLRRWLTDRIVHKVILDWSNIVLPINSIKNERLHYNRFLFRVYMFSQMYPEWFVVKTDKQQEVHAFISWLKIQSCLLNRPLQNKATDCSDKQKERGVESLFADKYSNLLKDKTGVTYLNSQLPVGLFRGSVKAKNAIFTRGLSAIDLWGTDVNTNTLYVYELKYQNNMIGIISELFFYLMILNEACCKDCRWVNFEEKALTSQARGINELTKMKFSNLRGFLLVDTIHPLIDNEVVDLFNKGLSRYGNISVNKLLYDYNDGDLKWQA